MLLQRQYSLWKMLNIIVGIILLLFLFVILFFKWRISVDDTAINEKNAIVLKLNNQLEKEKNKPAYKHFRMAEFIKENENNTNYYALYKYLKSIKDDIEKALTKAGIKNNRFQLSVDRKKVNISTAVPSYNFLYDKKLGVFEELEKRPFIEKISVNSYKSQEKLIYFDINLQTK